MTLQDRGGSPSPSTSSTPPRSTFHPYVLVVVDIGQSLDRTSSSSKPPSQDPYVPPPLPLLPLMTAERWGPQKYFLDQYVGKGLGGVCRYPLGPVSQKIKDMMDKDLKEDWEFEKSLQKA